MRNHEMMNYGFKEATASEGVMPKVAEKIGTVGASNVNVKRHGMEAKGMDALEVIDVQAAFGEKTSEDKDDCTEDEGDASSEPDFTKDEVVLGTDYAPDETVVIENGTKTINLNGKTLTAPIFTDESDNSSNSYGLWVKGGEVTIEGKGEIVAQDAMYSMAIWANGGNVVIKGGTFRNSGDSCDLIYVSAGGKVVIEGGEFFPAGPATGAAPGTKNPYTALNVKDADYKSGKSSIEVRGGIFHNFNPAENVSEEWPEGHSSGFVAEGFKSVEVEANVWEVKPE